MTNKRYLQEKIVEALSSSGGRLDEAQRLLAKWALDDGELLVQLIGPYLHDIAGRVVKDAAKAAAARRAVSAKRSTLAPGDFDSLLEVMQQNFGPTPPSTEPTSSRRGRLPASKRHVDALRAMSRAQLSRRFDMMASDNTASVSTKK